MLRRSCNRKRSMHERESEREKETDAAAVASVSSSCSPPPNLSALPQSVMICQRRPGLPARLGAMLAGFLLQLKPKPTGAPPPPKKPSPVSAELRSSLFCIFGFFISFTAAFGTADTRCLFTSSEPVQDLSAALGLMICRGGRGPKLDPGDPGASCLPCLAAGEEKYECFGRIVRRAKASMRLWLRLSL